MTMHSIDPATLGTRERYQFLISSIVPRPVAFVSTISGSGVTNLAPFSYFNGVSSTPPVVSIAIGPKSRETQKDTLRNIEGNGELVINIVSEAIAEQMVLCSGEWPADESEFEISGLTPVPSSIVRPPRVGECHISFECRAVQIVPVGNPPTGLVLAEVLLIHADGEVLTDGVPDPRKLHPLARLGGTLYASLGEILSIQRPDVSKLAR